MADEIARTHNQIQGKDATTAFARTLSIDNATGGVLVFWGAPALTPPTADERARTPNQVQGKDTATNVARTLLIETVTGGLYITT